MIFQSRVIAAARGRDSGAQPGHNVSLLLGQIGSGGSVVNWSTMIDEGSEFEIRNFPRAKAHSDDRFEVISINGKPAKEAVTSPLTEFQSRKELLLAELADVDRQLDTATASDA